MSEDNESSNVASDPHPESAENGGGGEMEEACPTQPKVTRFSPQATVIDVADLPAATTHRLTVKEKGNSEVEMLARDIEDRRNGRMKMPHHIKSLIIRTFKRISQEKGYPHRSAVKVSDLYELRDKIQTKVDAGENYSSLFSKGIEKLGFRNTGTVALEVLNKAVSIVEELKMSKEDKWYFTDFMFYFTENEAFFPMFRMPVFVALFWSFFFYLATPILFCVIYRDEGICPYDPTSKNRSYYGWLSSLYFASATMSTVGYGDLSVTRDARWKVFLGICYMIVAMLVAVMSFSAVIESSFSKYKGIFEGALHKSAMYFRKLFGWKPQEEMLLFERIQLLKYVKVGDIAIQFTVLNLIGVFVSRFFVNTDPDLNWTWMESLYWAVQTTTTIGYGDMPNMNFSMRWFQVFYLVLGTYFVGYTLGKLNDLSTELRQMKRQYAWERRETDRAMVETMQGGREHDGRVDQYEFVLASLLTLNKVSASDVEMIMDKFRELSDDSGFIQVAEAADTMHTEETLDEVEVFEVEGIDADGNHRNAFMRAMSLAMSTRDLTDLNDMING